MSSDLRFLAVSADGSEFLVTDQLSDVGFFAVEDLGSRLVRDEFLAFNQGLRIKVWTFGHGCRLGSGGKLSTLMLQNLDACSGGPSVTMFAHGFQQPEPHGAANVKEVICVLEN